MNVITSNANSIDRISNLPDPLLCHILSFLTTKEAATTSVLSKQWRYLWILVPDIHVIDSQIRRTGLYRLKHVIYNILLRKAPSNIQKIRLQSNTKSNHQFLSIFLSRAPACNVEELDLHVWNWVDHNSKRVFFKLPRSVFSYEKLVILKLTREICVDVVSSVQLPSLKVLHLLCVRYKGDESARSLISGCPVLDDLVVKRAKFDGAINSYDISSRSLTNLWVDCRYLDFDSNKLHEVDAPALKYLTLINPLLSSFQFISDSENLVEANINIGYRIKACEREAMASLFRALCNVKSMQLRGIFKALLNTHDYQHAASFKRLPNFYNLVTLKLSDIYCVWCIFKGLLPKFPQLEHLTILKVQRCYCCDMPHYPMPSTFVPTCLSYHLTTFKLQRFEGLELELDFIKCIMENSKALMNVTIGFSPIGLKNKFRFQKKISRFVVKCSTICKLSFE